MMKISFRQGLYAILSLACMLMIYMLSAQPAVSSQLLSEGVLDRLLQLLGLAALPASHWLQLGIRKLAHFAEYCLLGLSTSLFFRQRLYDAGNKGYGWVLQALLLCFVYACSDEWHQSFVPGRSMQFSDVVLDTAGAAAAAVSLVIADHFSQVWKGKGKKSDE